MTVVIILVAIVALIAGWHGGHAHSNYRHARAAGHGRKPSLYIGARGTWVSLPGPFGTRIGHRL